MVIEISDPITYQQTGKEATPTIEYTEKTEELSEHLLSLEPCTCKVIYRSIPRARDSD
jgi:hypothetical protein